MKPKLITWALAVVGAACALPTASAALPELDIPYTKYVLPNGLTLIVHEDHKAPIIAVNIWYHVGSKDEKLGRTGFAHLFEHLMFNGSQHHNDEFFRPLEPAGATKMNGSTWLDRTNYMQNVPVSALDLTLWLESDRMGYMLGVIDQKKLDEQRGVVKNEKREAENRPYRKALSLIASSTYPVGHPYSWPTIGSMEDLDAASLENVKDWFRAYYGAANAVIVLAGDVHTAEAKERVEHYFGDIPSGPPVNRQQAWIAKMQGERRAMLKDRVPQTRIYKTWNIPGYATREYTLLEMTAAALAGGKNSRLYKRLVHADQMATEVEGGVGPFELGSQLQLSVTVRPGGDPRAVEKALDEELAVFLRNGPSARELERIRMTAYANFVRGMERVDGIRGKAAILAQSHVYGASPDFYRQQLRWTGEASRTDVQRAANQWLSDGVFVLEVQPTPDYTVAKSGADRSKLPATGKAPALKLPPLQRTTLSNGLRVALAERHNAPVVDITLLIDAGHAADSQATPGTAKIMMSMLDAGTATRSALEIAEAAERLGARLSADATLDTSWVSVNTLTSRLPESSALLSEVALAPDFPERELTRIKAQTLAAIAQEKTRAEGIGMRLLPGLMYDRNHPYANPTSGSGTAESVAALSRAKLRAFHERWMRPDNASLLIVGDTTLEAITPLLERHFSAWRAPAESAPKKRIEAVARQVRPRIFLVDRARAEQSMIVAGYPATPRSDVDYIALEALNAIIGGKFLSRINMNLREDKHWSYGARSSLLASRGQGPFTVRASVQTDKTADAMREILHELRDVLTTRPPTEAEVRFARDSLVLQLPGNNETSSEVARSYTDVITFGLADGYWNDYVEQVRTITPTQLASAADKLICPDALTWIVVGDLAQIEGPIRALEIGEVRIVDADGNIVG